MEIEAKIKGHVASTNFLQHCRTTDKVPANSLRLRLLSPEK